MKLLRYSLLLLVVAIIAFGGTTALAAESWVADPVTGTRICYVHDTLTLTSASWSGSAVDGKADGSGKLTMTFKGKDDKTYSFTGDAEMKAGIINGRVAIKWSDGYSYDGTYATAKWKRASTKMLTATSMRVISKITIMMAMAFISSPTEASTKANGKKAYMKAKAFISSPMEAATKANGKTTYTKAKAYSNTLTAASMKATSKTMCPMVTA